MEHWAAQTRVAQQKEKSLEKAREEFKDLEDDVFKHQHELARARRIAVSENNQLVREKAEAVEAAKTASRAKQLEKWAKEEEEEQHERFDSVEKQYGVDY